MIKRTDKGYYHFKPNVSFKRYIGTFNISNHGNYDDAENWVYMSGFWLHERHRGKGYARRMIRDAIRLAKKLGYQRMYLDVNPNNLPAIKTYRGAGFRFVRKRHGFTSSFRTMRLSLC